MYRIFKFFNFLVLCAFFLFVKDLKAYNCYFVWEKTEIDIPLGKSVYEYKDRYKVIFYVDGKTSNDYKVSYEENCTTFTTVTTSVIGNYTVYYKAYSKTYGISETVPIIFHVVDNIEPTINPDYLIYRLPYGQRMEDYSWLHAKDNHTSTKDLIYKLDDRYVCYDALGQYHASIAIYDEFNNKKVYSFYLEIFDDEAPKITLRKELAFPYGVNVDPSDYFLAIDNYDGDISKNIIITNLDVNTLGDVTIMVKVADSSGNFYEARFKGYVYDDKKPEIKLRTNLLNYDILEYENLNLTFFEDLLLSASDNETTDLRVEIDSSSLICQVGDYDIIYRTVDNSGNMITEILKIRLREKQGPTIVFIGNDNYELGTTIDPYSLVLVTDLFDDEAKNTLEIIYNEYNPNKEGNYRIRYRAYNSSGLFTEEEFVLKVINSTAQENDTLLIPKPYWYIGGIVIILLITFLVLFKKRKRV